MAEDEEKSQLWKDQFVKFVNDKVPNSGLCKECGEKTMTVPDHIVAPPVFVDGGFALGGRSYPLIMLVCTNCGNTRFFNAVVAGAVNGPEGVER